MSLPTFKQLEDYRIEEQQQLAKCQEYAKKVQEAKTLVSALEIRYKEAISAAVNEGEDKSVILLELAQQRSAAVQALEDKRLMQQVANSVQQRSITKDDLHRGLQAFQTVYQAEQIDPEIEKLRALKIEYMKQFLEIERRRKHFENIARDVTYTINPNRIGLAYRVGFKNQPQIDKACVTQYDIESLQRGLVPNSVKGEVK